jgi:bifunctional UDP-N-acetylglucosamine pyrophosphorylase/glucosamine-1-phosphate N-acetyltransferase
MEEFLCEVKQNLEEILKDVKGCGEFLNCLRDAKFPWEILDLLETKLTYNKQREWIEQKNDVYILPPVYKKEGVEISPFSVLKGPIILGENTKIGPFVYIRPYTIIGNNCNISLFTGIKNSVILDNSNAAHFSYIGDSIIGKNCNFGAGSKEKEPEINEKGFYSLDKIIEFLQQLKESRQGDKEGVTVTSNFKHNEKEIKVHYKGKSYHTGRTKLGAIIENNVKIGCNATIYPGAYIGEGNMIDPAAEIRGYMEACGILMTKN